MLRLWKLGSLEHNIAPTQEGVNQLKSVLNNDNKTISDIVWGPEIELVLVPDNEDSEAVKLELIKRLTERGL